MAVRGRRSSRAARLLVLLGIVTVLGLTFGAGVYAGRIWSARSAVVAVRVPDAPEPARRGGGRGLKIPDVAPPQLTFYQELTAPLTAPPPPPKPAKKSAPPLVAVAPATPLPPAAPALRPGEQSDVLTAAPTATAVARDGATPASNRPPTSQSGAAAPAAANRFTIQVASYRVRPPADALREALASAGHDARVVQADANGPVYRVQVGEFATRDAARAAAVRLASERAASVAPFITTR